MTSVPAQRPASARPGRDRVGAGSPLPVPARTRPLRLLAAELEASDPYTSGHSRRVSRYSTLLGSHLGLTEGALRRLRTAALLHDVGTCTVPVEILHSPGRLSDAELDTVRGHAAEGAAMIGALIGDDAMAAIVRHHHERFDGGGYPDGLRGEQIPLGSRIIAVADTFDAVASRRPHRAAGSFQDALAELAATAGSQLDPEVVDAFGVVFDVLPGLGSLDLLSDVGQRLMRGPRCGRAIDALSAT